MIKCNVKMQNYEEKKKREREKEIGKTVCPS